MRFSILLFLLLILNQSIGQVEKPKYQSMAMGIFTPLVSSGNQDTISILIQDYIHVFKIASHSVTFAINEDDLGNQNQRVEKILYKYFAFDSRTKMGGAVFGDSIPVKNLSIDSFLTQRLPQFTSDSSLKLENYTYLKDSTKEFDLIETYLSKSTEKYKYPDSTILYYNSKFQDIEYGLNARKEKQVQINKKLQKLKLIYLIDVKDIKENAISNKMVISFELMDLPKNDILSLLTLAEKVKKYFESTIH